MLPRSSCSSTLGGNLQQVYCITHTHTRVHALEKLVVLQKAMHIIRTESLGKHLASVKSLAKSLTESLGESLGWSPQSLGSDYMHGSLQDSLRDSFFYAGGQYLKCDISAAN